MARKLIATSFISLASTLLVLPFLNGTNCPPPQPSEIKHSCCSVQSVSCCQEEVILCIEPKLFLIVSGPQSDDTYRFETSVVSIAVPFVAANYTQRILTFANSNLDLPPPISFLTPLRV